MALTPKILLTYHILHRLKQLGKDINKVTLVTSGKASGIESIVWLE
jgi:hypothetical protein